MSQFITLPRRVLKVSGDDARSFLQGLVTVDVNKLTPAAPRYAALLSPQGKILHDFFLIAADDAIWLDVDSSGADALQTHLLRYRLRAKVQVEKAEGMKVVAWIGAAAPAAPQGAIIIRDPRYAPLGWRLYGPSFANASADDAAYELHRLQLGVPDSHDFTDRSFIADSGFEALHGVDFDKGCYVGQEVTARTKFRGVVRKRFYRVEADGALPEAGTRIMQGGKEAGTLRSSQGPVGLAVLYDESVQGSEKLSCGNRVIRASLPAWAEAKITGAEGASGV